jgi:hypothetical protein
MTEYEEKIKKWKIDLPPGVIILDDLYFGPEPVQEVMKRYQDWKTRKTYTVYNSGAASAASVVSDGRYQHISQEVYPTLKKFALSSVAENEQELLLDLIPPPLKRLQNSMSELRDHLNRQSDKDLPTGEQLLLRKLQRSFVQAWIIWYEGVVVSLCPKIFSVGLTFH